MVSVVSNGGKNRMTNSMAKKHAVVLRKPTYRIGDGKTKFVTITRRFAGYMIVDDVSPAPDNNMREAIMNWVHGVMPKPKGAD